MTTTLHQRKLPTVTTSGSPGYNAPQRLGRALWAPMFALAFGGFSVGLVLSWVQAAEIAGSSPDLVTVDRLNHLVPAFMFIGFLGVFSAVSFAIVRILGAFRKGGGDVQEATGHEVHTLKMPATARLFMLTMMMGTMALVVAIVLHFVAAGNAETWAAESLARWAEVLEGLRRIGVALYLFGIAFGLGTIITVLGFQSRRITELAASPR